MKIFWISIKISLKFVPRGPINNFPVLVQIMACGLVGDGYFTDAYMRHSSPMWLNSIRATS